ncbi:MAG: LCP family protein [Candidatus Eremiobacteraeota bacterium]|nr:LCP family protein [Candidatus Eremiobacteraeota bacterium]
MGKHLAEDSPRNRPSVMRFIALALGICFVIGAIGILVTSVIRHENPIQVLTGSVVADPQSLFNKDRILVLLVGKDYDYDDHGYEFSKHSRSDVIQVYSLDFVNHTINELSVPRDMNVVLPNGHENKINQALSDGGIAEAQAVVAKFLGIPPFDRWVALRINSTKSVIDAIGGLDVPVKAQMDYDDNWGHLHIHFTPGMHHMNGEQAVSYARFRHDWCSDVCRIQRQQQILHILATKLKTDKFNDFAHLTTLISIVKNNVDTNMSTTELISLASTFSSIDPKTMKTAQVPYTDTKDTVEGGNVLVADETAKQKLVNSLLLDPPAPIVSPAPDALANIAPATLKVDVKNGTGVPGSARKIAAALKAKGFVIGDVGNAATSDYATTEIHEHTTVTFAGAKVRSEMNAKLKNVPIMSDVVSSPAPTSDVTIIVGKDFLTATSQQASIK